MNHNYAVKFRRFYRGYSSRYHNCFGAIYRSIGALYCVELVKGGRRFSLDLTRGDELPFMTNAWPPECLPADHSPLCATFSRTDDYDHCVFSSVCVTLDQHHNWESTLHFITKQNVLKSSHRTAGAYNGPRVHEFQCDRGWENA